MIKNYVLIALRRMSREKTYVLINILSLALGIASFLILALYLCSELTYDQHHANHERIYRLITRFQNAGSEGSNFAQSQLSIGPMLAQDYPQLGTMVRFQRSARVVLKHEDVERLWDDVYLADAAVFEAFTHKVLYGDPKTAFDSPYSIAVSDSFARYYFGEGNPIGKKISGADFSFAVTLVFEDLPENTHLKYDALLPMSILEVYMPDLKKNYANMLWNVGVFTYLMTPPEFDPADFDSIAQRFVDAHMGERMTELKTTFRAEFQPLAQVHFGERLEGDLPTGNIFYVYGFAAVAIFILLVACINYMNLATARATKRAKEVGMRKVLGATQPQLIRQFLGESLTFTVIALLVGLLLVEAALALTPIGSLMGKEHLLDARSEPLVLVGIVALSVLVALLSGLYPAFYLSAISPLAALTQVKKSWKTGFSMRQVLVFAQLSMSIGVIACTMLMTDQMRYIHDKPLGFDTENRLIVTLRGYEVVKNIKPIKNEVRREPGVLDVTTISVVPGTGHFINLIPTENNEGVIEPTEMDRLMVGLNFAAGLNVKVTRGRAFSEDIATDARESVMVNEAFVRKMGWDEPLGKRFQNGRDTFARVVGVVEDFHYASLHNAIGPLMIQPIVEEYDKVPEMQRPLTTTSIIVAMNGERIHATVDRVQAVIARFDPRFNFEPAFLDDKLNELYKAEASLMKLTGIFAGICIFISIMGLFGLAAFTTEQRTREIGIRKTLGASDWQIVTMLSRHLLLLVALAAVPASIASYYAIEKWLSRFAYRADIDLFTFVIATLIVTAVALATVMLQSAKTARADPVEALRYE